MADTTVHIGENSPDQVAYKLMRDIGNVEGRSFSNQGANPANREWIIRTYQQCRATVGLVSPIETLVGLGQQVQ